MDAQLSHLPAAMTGHSATVQMELHVGDSTFPVLQSAGDVLKLKNADQVPLGDATFDISVDGRVHRRMVRVVSVSARPEWLNIADR